MVERAWQHALRNIWNAGDFGFQGGHSCAYASLTTRRRHPTRGAFVSVLQPWPRWKALPNAPWRDFKLIRSVKSEWASKRMLGFVG